MGEVESGVVETLAQLGIKEPRTASEKMVLYLATVIDGCKEPEKLSGLSRELRSWLEVVRNQPQPVKDAIGALIDRQ